MSQIIPIYIPQYISSVDYQPARVQPRILFYNGQVECESFYVKNENAISQEVKNFPYFDNYNVSGSQFPTTGSKSLLFFNEAAAYGEVPTESLYSSYWSKYVSLLYSPRTRLLNASAIIPLADYFKMELNDIVEFRGNYYHLRAINDYNLKNGECDIQLLGPILGDVLPNLFTTTTTTLNPNCEYNELVVDCSGTTTTSTTSTTTTTAAPTTTTTTTLAPLFIEYLIVGAGGEAHSGGGGAGAFVTGSTTISSSLGLPVVAAKITTGTAIHTQISGSSSIFLDTIAIGGGNGGAADYVAPVLPTRGWNGACGGGGAVINFSAGGTGSAGFNGGTGANSGAGGGGGVFGIGKSFPIPTPGGSGSVWLDGLTYCAGGYGESTTASLRLPGSSPDPGGGGNWGLGPSGPGMVRIRYAGTPVAYGGVIVQSGSYTYHTFTGSLQSNTIGVFQYIGAGGTTTTTTSTTTTTVAPTGSYEIGQYRDGGYVFYVTGSFPNQSGLIAAPTIGIQHIPWGCKPSNIVDANYRGIGYGQGNTTAILNGCAERPIAASVADSYTNDGYNDWYLPTRDEMFVLGQEYLSGSNVGPIATALNRYWTSTQASGSYILGFTGNPLTQADTILIFPDLSYGGVAPFPWDKDRTGLDPAEDDMWVKPIRSFGPPIPTTTTSTTTTSTTTTTTLAPGIPTDGLRFWFDGSTWSGTGDWIASYGNATASLSGVTKLNENGGVLDFQSSSLLEVTENGVQPNYSTDYSTSIILVAKNSGSSALQHGRILNGVSNNWLFGNYADVYPGAWYNGNFVSDTNFGEDNNWRIMAGVQYSQPSASAFINNAYVDGLSGFNGYGPNGLAINKGAFIAGTNPNSGEYTYAIVGQILFYDKALNDSELTQIYNEFSGSYF